MASKTEAANSLQKEFERAGFTVGAPLAATLEVAKSGCVCTLENRDGRWMRSGPPHFLAHGIPCELEDHGYQKFWYSKETGRRFPIRKIDLETLYRFDAEVRYLLGLRSLYHESLGTTNARTVYDRLDGRPDR